MKKNIIKIDIIENRGYGYRTIITKESEDKIMNKLKERYKDYPEFMDFFRIHAVVETYPISSPYIEINWGAYRLEEIGRSKGGKVINFFSKEMMEELKVLLRQTSNITINLDLTNIYKKLDNLYSYYINYQTIKSQRKNLSKTLYEKIASIFKENGNISISTEYDWYPNKENTNMREGELGSFTIYIPTPIKNISLGIDISSKQGEIYISYIKNTYFRREYITINNIDYIEKEVKYLEALRKVMLFVKGNLNNAILVNI